jgi:hypothetical protein
MPACKAGNIAAQEGNKQEIRYLEMVRIFNKLTNKQEEVFKWLK